LSDLPSDEDVARITAEHLISTPLRPADLLFVFGQRRGDRQIAEKAVELWQRGLFRHAIVSGGQRKVTRAPSVPSSRTAWWPAACRPS
jgi:hypothetical protein